MNIEIGKSYRTRNGLKATAIDRDAGELMEWLVETPENRWWVTMHGSVGFVGENNYDLVGPWDEPRYIDATMPMTVGFFDPIAALRKRAIEHAETLPASPPRRPREWWTRVSYCTLIPRDSVNDNEMLVSGYILVREAAP